MSRRPAGHARFAVRRVLTALVCAAAAVSPAHTQPAASLAERILLAEDARAQTPAELATLRQSLTSPDLAVRRQAVRAIGRLERPDLIPALTPVLADRSLELRIEAANAVGQLARGQAGVASAKPRLLARAKVERDPRVWGVVAATLGRLPFSAASDVSEVETAIAVVLPTPTSTAIQIDAVLGATEGLEALARQSHKLSPFKATTIEALRAASALEGRPQDADKLARIRRFAVLALTAAGATSRQDLERGVADPDEEVRRMTMVAARAEVEGRESTVDQGLADQAPRVRYEALQTWGRMFQGRSCERLQAAVRDTNPHVALLAIDLLGNGCPAGQSGLAPLQALAELLTARPREWHKPAHALVSLAKVSPVDARTLLPRYLTHAIWQVRMYAARAAGVLAAIGELETLGEDPDDNVREAALGELVRLKRKEAGRVALAALSRKDYQLVRTAARALTADASPEAAPALLAAMQRITAERKDTSRDPRMAILDALKAIGGSDGVKLGGDPAAALAPYLTDFDSAVAGRTGELLQAWGRPHAVAPRPLPRPVVSREAVEALRHTRLRVAMAGLGVFELRLLVDDAPLTALRVATRAREGYYNGLTFHRVAPNFVIQGGSPGANEYVGDAAYMRDEVGLASHRRGTVGISTRGRDTGDAQIFVNLVDSPRLDHAYTVFAEVVSGMDVVDAVVEGDVIERVEVARTRP
ncbi:MAG: peptidylprolyl isomerase [Acidobacteriota bacterium]